MHIVRMGEIQNAIRRNVSPVWGSFAPNAPMKELYRSLGWRELRTAEGYSSRKQVTFFRHLLAENPTIKRILEIGFNAGHSSYAFLSARPDVTVLSFDLGEHAYVEKAKTVIDLKFPGRHTLVLGDSRETLPRYSAQHQDAVFDLIFIDGGHEYDVATADLINCQAMAHPSGLIVMDDLFPWISFGIGPVRAWAEAKERGIVEELRLVQDGKSVTVVRPKRVTTAAWAVGRYLFPDARERLSPAVKLRSRLLSLIYGHEPTLVVAMTRQPELSQGPQECSGS